ncbi:MAG: hypothetical protein Q7S02_03980 [bacterium]|nr:hypothetical protein [bacterium]
MIEADEFPRWFRGYRTRLRERGVSELRIVAMTYNTVWDFPNGVVPNAPPGLMMEVVNGDGRSSFVEDLDGEVFRIRPAVESDVTKGEGAAHIRDSAQTLDAGTRTTLVLLYAGISRFDEMCGVARTLRERGADVALVLCGCEHPSLASLSHEGAIVESFIGSATAFCHGGRDLLRDMVRASVAAWSPETEQVAPSAS